MSFKPKFRSLALIFTVKDRNRTKSSRRGSRRGRPACGRVQAWSQNDAAPTPIPERRL
jgi:hypothetical protein